MSREKLVIEHLKLSLLNTKIAVQKATELVTDHFWAREPLLYAKIAVLDRQAKTLTG